VEGETLSQALAIPIHLATLIPIMGTLIVQYGRFSDRLREKYDIQVVFPDASGIRAGSPVNLAGQKIGFVASEPELKEDFTGVKVRFRVFSLSKRKLGRTQPFGDGPGLQAVARYRVADTLRNEVTRRVRAVPSGDASRQGDRLALIEWLLEQARTESWIYEEALKQSEDYLQMSGQTLGGRRVMQKVLRAMGNFSEEVKLLVDGVTTINDQKVFVLKFLQGRNPDWVGRPFFARFDPRATWLNELRPALGEREFFFEPELRAMIEEAAAPSL